MILNFQDKPGCSLRFCITMLILYSAPISPSRAAEQVSPSQVLWLVASMESAWGKITEYTKDIEKTERLVDGSLKYERGSLKFRKPDHHYLHVDKGVNAGSEIIYPLADDKNLAIAHPGGIPGSLFRLITRTPLLRGLVPTVFSIEDPRIVKEQHHTIVGSNLGSVIQLIAFNLRTATRYAEGSVYIQYDAAFDDRPAYRLDVTLPGAVGVHHIVRSGENLWTIAQKHNQNMYVIRYNNSNVLSSVDLHPGQVLFIPRYYAPHGNIWICKKNLLPIKLEIHDLDGNLYESYVYSNIDLNPGLSDEDFDPRNPDYRF